ncbi:MAG: hypothetical protein AAB875_03105, partial [Patescibacteria group bacterium]
ENISMENMKSFIAQYYKTSDKALNRAKELNRMWQGKIAFYVIEAKNGFFVISEKQARLCFPYLRFSYKNRAYQ